MPITPQEARTVLKNALTPPTTEPQPKTTAELAPDVARYITLWRLNSPELQLDEETELSGAMQKTEDGLDEVALILSLELSLRTLINMLGAKHLNQLFELAQEYYRQPMQLIEHADDLYSEQLRDACYDLINILYLAESYLYFSQVEGHEVTARTLLSTISRALHRLHLLVPYKKRVARFRRLTAKP